MEPAVALALGLVADRQGVADRAERGLQEGREEQPGDELRIMAGGELAAIHGALEGSAEGRQTRLQDLAADEAGDLGPAAGFVHGQQQVAAGQPVALGGGQSLREALDHVADRPRVPGDPGVQRPPGGRKILLQQRLDEAVLAGEIAIDGRLGHPDGGRHLIHAGGLETLA